MATTSSDAALRAVAAIEGTGVRFAVLHGEADLARGEVDSDVDVVADRAVHDVVRSVAKPWAAQGLYPVVVWPYDVGGTGSIFLTTLDAQAGVQLDILCDPEGRGRYGARSDLLLGAAQAGSRFTTVAPAERIAYLLAKRISKGETSRARRLIEGAQSTGVDLDVLRSDVADVVGSFLKVGSITKGWSQRPSLGRVLRRLRCPAGGWVELRADDSEEVASELISRFQRFLPHARCIAAPHLGTWTTSVAPTRWRAGIVASHGMRIGVTPQPDLSIGDPVSADEACRRTVKSLATRYTQYVADRGCR